MIVKKKINKGEHRSKKAAPTTFYNLKHLKGWAKVPIPKQIKRTKNRKGQGIKIRKEIVQKYTASVQQTGRTIRDKGEKEWREVGARAS